jgi:asparagine synthase (glutamine-hydrolysing)
MCGLVGIWRRDGGEADRSAIASMLEPITHRGPDGKGVWQEGRVALGHVRLSIIDLTEGSHQPMLTADARGVRIYDGEVYNYREIRQELEREVIENLDQWYGVQCRYFKVRGDDESV